MVAGAPFCFAPGEAETEALGDAVSDGVGGGVPAALGLGVGVGDDFLCRFDFGLAVALGSGVSDGAAVVVAVALAVGVAVGDDFLCRFDLALPVAVGSGVAVSAGLGEPPCFGFGDAVADALAFRFFRAGAGVGVAKIFFIAVGSDCCARTGATIPNARTTAATETPRRRSLTAVASEKPNVGVGGRPTRTLTLPVPAAQLCSTGSPHRNSRAGSSHSVNARGNQAKRVP